MAPLLSLLSGVSLLTLAASQVVHFDIVKNERVQAAQIAQRNALMRRDLQKRVGTLTATLTNSRQQGLYFANVSVGTPPQNFALQIDTGSSDVWVPAAQSAQCTTRTNGGCPDGSFNYKSSSTFVDIDPDAFNISYVDGTGSVGDYIQDTFRIGGETLTGFTMGLALDTSIGTGIMGIGYNTSEANVFTGNGTIYQNLPLAMVGAGLINSAAYSLWLNDLQSNTGNVLFGGIDTEKYVGDLTSIMVYPSARSGKVSSFTVAFTSLSASSSSGEDQLTPPGYAQAAILDSGTTITLLPDDVAQVVFEELGATYQASLGAVVVPCALSTNTGTLNYGFGGVGGPVIKVSVSDIVLPLVDSRGRSPTYSNGQKACQLGIQAAGDLPVLFGDTFMRSAYVVYDLINNRIALAQTDFNETGSNIVPFASSGAPIPSATSAANEAAVTQTRSGLPKVIATATGTGIQATYNPTATGLNAASGFAATSTSTKKNGSASGPEPFAWSRVLLAGVTVSLMGLGGGFFVLL